jgi:pimeloyl-ACP methyl ester carboxylesterase
MRPAIGAVTVAASRLIKSKHIILAGFIIGLLSWGSPAATQGLPGSSATPAVNPVAIPDTPVGEQLTWILAQFNGDASTLTEADLNDHVTPSFMAAFPFPLIELLRDTATQYAPITVTQIPWPPTATGIVAEVDLGSGEHAAIYLVIEATAPHRITRLDLSEAPAPASASGRRVSIGDRALYLDCQGSGGPTVVLEGGISSDWAEVQAEAAGFTRVCSYDRPDSPGSRSDPTATRTAQEVVDDLHAVLDAAGEPGPYVLVGHSMGGLYVQLYAYQHPDEVAGLVLVDPTPEDFSMRLGELAAGLGTPVPTTAPAEPGPDEISFAQMREARASGALPQVPLVVLSHGRGGDPAERPPGWPIEEEERIWRELHAEIAQSVPGGKHIIAEKSGHDIHQEEPMLVVSAIRQVVDAARNPDTTATPAAG